MASGKRWWGPEGEGLKWDELRNREKPVRASVLPVSLRPDPAEELAREVALSILRAGHEGRAGAVVARRAAVLIEAACPTRGASGEREPRVYRAHCR